LPFITGIDKWNINSVEPSYLDYEDDIDDGGSDQTNFWSFLYSDVPFRCSDHDPVLVGLRLGPKLSINHKDNKLDLKVFPNPTKQNLFLHWADNAKMKLEVFNALGQRLMLSEQVENNTNIDVSQLAVGVYILKMTSEQQKVAVISFVKN
jgi:hypothetical protein